MCPRSVLGKRQRHLLGTKGRPCSGDDLRLPVLPMKWWRLVQWNEHEARSGGQSPNSQPHRLQPLPLERFGSLLHLGLLPPTVSFLRVERGIPPLCQHHHPPPRTPPHPPSSHPEEGAQRGKSEPAQRRSFET